MATAKKSGKRVGSAKAAARKPAKASARTPAKAAKSAKSEIVYSDVRRDALAWQLSRLR